MSELRWVPGRAPRSVVVDWPGNKLTYQLYWGDGTSSTVSSADAVSHTYTTPGRYTVVAIGDAARTTATTEIVVREWTSPTVTTSLGADRRTVNAEMSNVDDPVLWSIDWGDGTVDETTSSTGSHVYADGYGTTQITVEDVPSKRVARLTGPVVPYAPRATWHPTTWGRGTMHLAHFPPGVEVSATWDTEPGDTGRGSVTTNTDGTAQLDMWVFHPDYNTGDHWQSVPLTWTDPDTSQPRLLFVPIRCCEFGVTREPKDCCTVYCPGLPVTFDWDDDNPYRITITVDPADDGDFTIDWGNGAIDVISAQHGRVRAAHDYQRPATAWITVTHPDGKRQGYRRVAPFTPELRRDGADLGVFWPVTGDVGNPKPGTPAHECDPYSPARVFTGDGRVYQWHRPALNCKHSASHWASNAGSFRITAPMTMPMRHSTARLLEQDATDDSLNVSWVAQSEWDGGYSGQFSVSNDTDEDVSAWHLDFELPSDARAAEVWPADTYAVARLEGSQVRWRVSCDTPIPAGTTAHVGVRVEPSGKTKSHPTEMRARPTRKDSDE